MASVYKRKNKIYISWYDALEGKNKSKSLGIDYSKSNMKAAKKIAAEFQKELNNRDQNIKSLKINKKSIEFAFKHFLENNSNKHPGTIWEYNWFYDKFTKHFNAEDNCTVLTKLSCEKWLISLRNTNYAQNTLFKLSKVLNKFLNFLFEYSYLPMFKINSDIKYRIEVKPIVIFSIEDLKLMVKGLENKSSNFKTVFYLLLYTGLRPSDIFDLKVEDVNLDEETLSYYSSKTKTYSTVPIHPDLVAILLERINTVKSGRLFEYQNYKYIGRAINRYLKELGIKNKRYDSRTFRKTFISLGHASGMDLATVTKLVGHSRITTTEKYYNKLSLSKKQDELSKLKLPLKEPKMNYYSEGESEGVLGIIPVNLDDLTFENSQKTQY